MFRQAILVLLIGYFGYFLLQRIVRLGYFQNTFNHSPGKCFRLQKIVNGSEDIQILPDGLAFISSGLAYLASGHRERGAGKIYLFDFNHPTEPPTELKLIGEKQYTTIEPHGISTWINPQTGEVFLYLVNHARETETVEKFRFNREQLSLEHVRSIESKEHFHIRLNDLYVVGDDQFYYTNFVYWDMFYEMLFGLKWGQVGFFDGNKASIVVDGIVSPNGITVSKDGKHVYVANVGEGGLNVYKRNADNSLTFEQSVVIAGIVDNLDIDADTGDLWTGNHPGLFGVMDYLHNLHLGHVSPSQVLRIRFPSSTSDSSSRPEITEIYADDGSHQEASTVAAKYKNAFLIGSVCTGATYCEL